ncbi:RIO1 family regulatory kinase/ATPase domain-containing protein [Natronorubrum tibetense]|uniref:non-specific serine/threonine protein kinase n=1 Tax=Natronorubrum tibetense GA33 TaxID=1114856 RepID=L9W2Y0_9EURY|nr:RIO-like kinase [Natronorubrum tibetense GA33]
MCIRDRYIGDDEGRAKRLGEVHIENPQTAYEVMREYMRRLYSAGIIHGDLSEYNVVFDEGQLVIIDVGQAVTVHHPNSRTFLERDCRNVASFFSRQGLETDEDELLEFVTSPEPDPSGE